MHKFIFIIIFLNISPLVFSQELECSVTINGEKIQFADKRVFEEMRIAFEQFLNQQKWTSDVFEPHERIKCNMSVIIDKSPGVGRYSATVQIQSARPVFNSSYESILFNFADRDWEFEYVESQPMNFSDNNFNTNLTSMLAFYAYIILGFDYDSFGDLAGTPYFQKALNIVNNSQQTNWPGWKSLESNRNRYWLIENLTNKRMEIIRKSLYTYHRKGLDIFYQDGDTARKEILTMLRNLHSIKRQYPTSILVISFMDAKNTELINIYSEGDIQLRRQAFNFLSEINPSKREDYSKIIN